MSEGEEMKAFNMDEIIYNAIESLGDKYALSPRVPPSCNTTIKDPDVMPFEEPREKNKLKSSFVTIDYYEDHWSDEP